MFVRGGDLFTPSSTEAAGCTLLSGLVETIDHRWDLPSGVLPRRTVVARGALFVARRKFG